MNEQEHYSTANLSHPLQDVHRERSHAPDLYRYRVAEALLPENIAGKRVFELGGGIAEFSRRMREHGVEPSFVDLNDRNVERARQLGFAAYQMDLNAGLAPFADASFDGVVMLEIIEHVVASEFLLAECCRVLRPSGFLILSTPNFAFLPNRMRVLGGRLSIDEGYHYRFFTLDVLRRRLADAGFAVVAEAHSAPMVGVNFVVNRMLKKKRRHMRVPRVMSALLAQTLMIRAEKIG
jgi:2-polyprenyl-3-methyl-5-hydroxy-6-metoxy-1,4-benzoquinol methylase